MYAKSFDFKIKNVHQYTKKLSDEQLKLFERATGKQIVSLSSRETRKYSPTTCDDQPCVDDL